MKSTEKPLESDRKKTLHECDQDFLALLSEATNLPSTESMTDIVLPELPPPQSQDTGAACFVGLSSSFPSHADINSTTAMQT